MATTTKRNPLIAALLEQLPADGTWPRAARLNWLRMFVMAMNQAYGEVAEIAIDPVERVFGGPVGGSMAAAAPVVNGQQFNAAAGVDVAPARKPLPAPPHIYIDLEGFVRQSPGDLQLTKEAVGANDVIFDYRGETGDLGSIIWADGSRGVVGVRADISAGAPR